MFTLLLASGCGGSANTIDNGGVTQQSENGDSNTNITLQLNWIPDAQHGGYLAAQHEGHFAQQGITAEIRPGGPGTAVLPQVAMGRCDFAIANADQVLMARAQGADVVALFAALQDSPRCILVHEASGITSLTDLANVTLALGNGKAFAEYMKRHLPLNNVRVVSYSGSVAKFLVDPKFAQQGYIFSEPIVARHQGGSPKALMVSELGFNPYSSMLVARRELWQQQPDLVRRVVAAVRAGWHSYCESPQKTNQEIQRLNSDMQPEILADSVAALVPLCKPSDDQQLGSMTGQRWADLRNQLIEIELLPDTAESAEQAFIPEL